MADNSTQYSLPPDLAQAPAQTAGNRLLGVQGIPPDLAASAQVDGLELGLHPDTALVGGPGVAQQAQAQRNQATVAANPHLQSYINGASNAQVATIQDDLPALHRVTMSFGDYMAQAGPVGDFTAAWSNAWKAAGEARAKQLQAQAQGDEGGVLAAGGQRVLGALGVLGSPFAPLVEGIARAGFAAKNAASSSDFLASPSVLAEQAKWKSLTPGQRAQEAEQVAGIVSAFVPLPAFKLGGAKAVGEAEGLGRGPTGPSGGSPGAPPEPSDLFAVNEEGHVLDPAGNPMEFTTQKDAAKWILKEGYAQDHTQIFEPSVLRGGSEGTEPVFGVRMSGRQTVNPDVISPQGVDPQADAFRANLAQVDADQISQVQAALAESKTLTTSPQTAESILESQAPGAIARVPPETLGELAAEGHVPFPDHLPQVAQALLDGSDLEIPLSKYLVATAGQPYADKLNAATTFRDDGVSIEGAKDQPPPAQTPIPPPTDPKLPDDFSPEESQRALALTSAFQAKLTEVVRAQYLSPLFKDGEALGMTKDQFARYSHGIERTVQDAVDKMHERAVGQILRERKPDWKAAVAQHYAASEQALTGSRSLQAYSYLTRGKDVLGSPIETPFKLEVGDQLSKHGLDLGLPKTMFSQKGVPVDLAAEELGYPSGADLIRELNEVKEDMERRGVTNSAEHIKALAQHNAEVQARDELGFDITPEAIHALASEIVNGPKVTEFLGSELTHLAQMQNLPFDLNNVEAYAKVRFDALPVKDALNIRKFEGYVYKSGIKAEKALLKGDLISAFKWKQTQFIQHIQLSEAHKFTKAFNSADRTWGRLAKSPSRDNIAQGYLDAVHGELAKYGYRVPQANLKYNYEQWAKGQEALGLTVPPYQPVPPIKLKSLTVDQFNDLKDRIDNMVSLGKDAQGIIVDGKRVAHKALVQEAVDAAKVVALKPRLKTTVPKAGVEGFLRRLDVELGKVEFMLDKLDDDNPHGVFNRVLMRGANDAHATEIGLQREVLEAINGLRSALSKEERAGWMTKVGSGHGLLDPVTGEEMALTNYDLLSAAANRGNATNLWHLGEGGWNWDLEQLHSLIEANVTKEGMGFVQGVLDILDKKLWPRIVETERTLSGLAPERVEATPFVHRGVTYAGGYFPLVRDAARAGRIGPSVSDLDHLMDAYRTSATTPKGFTKKRTRAEYPVLLDLQNVLFDHVTKVTKRVAFEEFLQNSGRFLRDKQIARLVEDVHGPHGMPQITDWLHRQVGARLIDPRAIQSASAFFRNLRENVYMVGAGMRLTVGLEHASTFGQVASLIGGKTAGAGYVRLALDPLGATKFAMTSSSTLAARVDEVNRELRDTLQDIRDEHRLLPANLAVVDYPVTLLRKAGHFFITWINQYTVAVPAWLGAYHSAVEGTAIFRGKAQAAMSHSDAVRYADKIVTEAHGSGAEKDLSKFQSGGNEFFKILNMYYNYHGSQMQLNRGAINRVLRGRGLSERVEGLREGFWAIIFSSIVGSIVADKGVKKLTGVDIAAWMSDTILGGIAQGVPVGREGYQMVSNRLKGRPWDYNVSPAGQAGVVTGQAAEDLVHIFRNTAMGKHDRISPRALQHIIEAPGYFMGLPTGQIAASAQGIADIGKPENKHPIKGVLFGPSHEKD